jgi:hypothetical protein
MSFEQVAAGSNLSEHQEITRLHGDHGDHRDTSRLAILHATTSDAACTSSQEQLITAVGTRISKASEAGSSPSPDCTACRPHMYDIVITL